MNKRLRLLLISGMAVLVLLAGMLTSCTEGQVTAAEGILQNVDNVTGQITIKMKDGSVVTIDLKDVSLDTIRKTLGSVSLEKDDEVTVERTADGKVKRLKAHSAELEGTVKATDNQTDNTTVTITSEKKGDITLQVTPDTMIRFEEQGTGNFGDIQIGQQVEAKYDVDTMKAIRLNIGSDEDEQENESDDDERENEGENGENEGENENGGNGETEGAPKVPHTLVGRENCLSCHGPNGIEPFPRDHQGRTNDICLGCHQGSSQTSSAGNTAAKISL